jgi:hypothetical protein
MMVMVPFLLSESAMVNGILSPLSSILIITNCPAFLLWAILGEKISNRLMFGAKNLADTICGMDVTLILLININVDLHKMCHYKLLSRNYQIRFKSFK